jgi:hypothetical protein
MPHMNKRLLSLAMILLLSGVFTFFMATDTADASKTTIGKQLVQVREQLLDDSAEYRRNSEDGSIALTIRDLEDFGKVQDFSPDIFIPDRIPERFLLESLTVTCYGENNYTAEYAYKAEDGSRLTIRQETGKKISITGDLKKDEVSLILGQAETKGM